MKAFTILIFIIQLTSLHGQNIDRDLLSNGGGLIKGDNLNIHWSTGEIAVSSNQNGVKISEGFHQGASITTSLIDVESNINISIYPNPTSDIVNIQKESGDIFTAEISSYNGALIHQQIISNKNTQIDFNSFLPGTYIISFKNTKGTSKSYKIIKI